MSTTLRSHLNVLATTFATSVLEAIRGASLEELLAESGASRAARRAAVSTPSRGPTVAHAAPRKSTGRLRRRSPEQIASMLDRIVALVKKHKGGLRAEQIRAQLGMLPKEMPRILKDGLASKKLTAKGQKRATTYFAR